MKKKVYTQNTTPWYCLPWSLLKDFLLRREKRTKKDEGI